MTEHFEHDVVQEINSILQQYPDFRDLVDQMLNDPASQRGISFANNMVSLVPMDSDHHSSSPNSSLNEGSDNIGQYDVS